LISAFQSISAFSELYLSSAVASLNFPLMSNFNQCHLATTGMLAMSPLSLDFAAQGVQLASGNSQE